MGGKKRRTKKHNQHHHPGDVAAVRAPSLLQLNPNSNHSFTHPHQHQQQKPSQPHHDEEHSCHPSPEQDRDTDMIDVSGDPSGAGLHHDDDHRPQIHHNGPVGARLKEVDETERHEVTDTLSPLPEIRTEPPSRQSLDLDLTPMDPNSASPALMGSSDSNHLEMPDNYMAEPLEVDDDESIFSPSQYYPAISPRYRVERPFDSATVTSSRSLWAEDLDYFWENGRRYCGNYFMPNDEEEQDRLRIVHQVYLLVFDLELTSVPLEDPEYILDIGTGTGEWAIGMGELYPDCEVVGTDISAIQPSAVPHNVFFEIDDAELEWTRPENSADLIHIRHLSGAFADWHFIYQQAFATLKPGGYLELVDFDEDKGFRNFFSFFPVDSEIAALARDLAEASKRSGRPRGMVHLAPTALADIGFVEIEESERSIPLSPTELTTGKLWLVACLCSLEALCLRPLTNYMGWPAERVRDVCDIVAQELKDLALNNPEKSREVVLKVRILVGRKPETTDEMAVENLHRNGHVEPAEGEVTSIM